MCVKRYPMNSLEQAILNALKYYGPSSVAQLKGYVDALKTLDDTSSQAIAAAIMSLIDAKYVVRATQRDGTVLLRHKGRL